MTVELTAPAQCLQSYDGWPLPILVVVTHPRDENANEEWSMSTYHCDLYHALRLLELDVKLAPGSEVEGLGVV